MKKKKKRSMFLENNNNSHCNLNITIIESMFIILSSHLEMHIYGKLYLQ
jgi:hypothetical protein